MATQAHSDLSRAVFAVIDAAFAYTDLEVNPTTNRIFRLGVASYVARGDFLGDERLATGRALLGQTKSQDILLCGHNFRRFDALRIAEQWPELQSWPAVDTLELSVIANPLDSSHRLQKDYKPSAFSVNNPYEDALGTRELLWSLLQQLAAKPRAQRNAYVWLLTCGDTEADTAYRRLFGLLGWSLAERPSLNQPPSHIFTQLDADALNSHWFHASSLPFDVRLSVAGIIAWAVEAGNSSPAHGFSNWLLHVPYFRQVLDALRPLRATGFTYQPYLEYFGVPGFRDHQEEAVRAILDGQRPLLLMPTGGGKSLCFQLPALMLHMRQRALSVVISPLQALMDDQVHDLQDKGLTFATYINGTLSASERQQRLDQLWEGSKSLLYISPEQLRSVSIRKLLQERVPALFVIDEAHCISQWGHDFRTDYRYIPKYLAQLLKDRPQSSPMRLALVTATATHAVREDVSQIFADHGFPIEVTINAMRERHNLTFHIINAKRQTTPTTPTTDAPQAGYPGASSGSASYPAAVDGEGDGESGGESDGEGATEGAKLGRLVQLVRERLQRGGAILIYTTTRKSAEHLAAMLKQHEINTRHFHGKISREEKREVLEAFKSGALNVVTATCAFGMGINRADVRTVIHHTMSHNLEGYLQEAGRAGRDGQPADCILFFDPDDAETIFYLQSLNQLSETELCRIFEAIRRMRDRIFDRAADDWFFVTVDDLLQEGSFDEAFGKESEQRETKVKVALHYLEQFGLTERAENQSNYLRCDLAHATVQASLDRFNQYAREHHFSEYQMAVFTRLIEALHLARTAADRGEEIPLREYLSDAAGIEAAQVIERVRELQRAGVCSYEIPVTLLIRKGVRSSTSGKEMDAKRALSLLEQTEQRLLAALKKLAAKDPDRMFLPIHLRGLAQLLDTDGSEQIRAETLLKLLEEWTRREWLSMQRLNRDSIKIRMETIAQAADHLDTEQELRAATLDAIYEEIGAKTGARLRVTVEMQRLAKAVNARLAPVATIPEDLEKTMLALHQLGVIRITDGLQLMRQALKVRVIPRAAVTVIHRSYPLVEAHYRQQAQRTHIMLHYGSIAHDELVRRRFVEDYFRLPADAFARAYPGVTGEAMERPLTQDDYNRIMGELNPEQREIAQAGDAALVVIAGPGSGKTRTIVHRIAYLVKVRRVEPQRILVLAYNRNAVRDLRLRLLNLVGSAASKIEVYTFHGYALKILGRTFGEQRGKGKISFDELIPRACELLEQGDELEEDEDTRARRLRLLGSIEHIFVDEYQDVNKDMYRFLRRIAGLGDSGDDDTRKVHINTCVIGDDDQNLYTFVGADVRYIREFEQEFGARRLLLVENYRSTEAIIEASNRLIAHNANRCKSAPDEQVRIDDARQGQRARPGASVSAYRYESDLAQATGLSQMVERWIQQDGVAPNEIAIMARNWEQLDVIRLLLERAGVATRALGGKDITLLQHFAACQLLDDLRADILRQWEPSESVERWVCDRASQWGRSLHEPTVRALRKIARDLEREHGFGTPDTATSISADEFITALFEHNGSDTAQTLAEPTLLMTSCHSAKGLEFRKVIVLADGFTLHANQIESERRAFYVAMTRAKEELILATLDPDNVFVAEAGLVAQPVHIAEAGTTAADAVTQRTVFLDLNPWPTNLSHPATQQQQKVICSLQEGCPLTLRATRLGDGWLITTDAGIIIGMLSNGAYKKLAQKQVKPNQFRFQPGEVTLRAIFHHVKTDEVTGDVQEDWFVPIPQIRICR